MGTMSVTARTGRVTLSPMMPFALLAGGVLLLAVPLTLFAGRAVALPGPGGDWFALVLGVAFGVCVWRCAVYGPAGTGKSTLARRAARAVEAHFPDGQVWLDLRSSNPLTAQEVNTALHRALGVTAEEGNLAHWPDVVARRRARAR